MSMTVYYLLGVLVMAVATYIPRALPFALFRRPVRSRFIKSFLEYMPVAVLAAMTFPAIIDSTATPLSAILGMLVALVFSYIGWQLMPVALISCGTVFLAEWVLPFITAYFG